MRDAARILAVQSPVIPVVAELIRQYPGTISLGQGVVHYAPPSQSVNALQTFLADAENHKYKLVDGLPLLLEGLSTKLREENKVPVGGGNRVMVTAGGNMAFMNAILAIADPGDEIILQTPYYFNHEMAVTIANARAVLVATDSNYQLRPEAIRQAITPRTRAIVTISPNNPTGAVYPENSLREVNQICQDRGLYHIHDEAYENFLYDGATHFSPASLPNSVEHTISLFSFSKAYGFASWRIGYMVLPEHLVTAVKKIQDTILICAPVISQYAAAGALQAGSAYCREKLAEITEVRHLALQAFSELKDICTVPPAGGAFYFLLRLRAALDPMEIAGRLIREHRVAVIPGNAFGVRDECCLRVAYAALRKDTAAEALGRLVSGLRKISGEFH
jgi:aspartate/methionine/tyrosine aminotransferase